MLYLLETNVYYERTSSMSACHCVVIKKKKNDNYTNKFSSSIAQTEQKLALSMSVFHTGTKSCQVASAESSVHIHNAEVQ